MAPQTQFSARYPPLTADRTSRQQKVGLVYAMKMGAVEPEPTNVRFEHDQ